MARQSMQLTVSLPPELYRKMMDVGRKEIRSKSELVREALRDYIGRRELFLQARMRLSRELERRGVRALADVERLVDEHRRSPAPGRP